jgi:parvulin-like peptidyl-prolyl isomerase
MRRLAVALMAAMVVVSGCAKPPATARAGAGDDVVATFDGGRITAADLDRALLALPAGQVRMQAMSSVESLEQLVRQLALQRLLLAEAGSLGLDRDPEFLKLVDGLRRDATVALFFETHPSAPEPPTEAELRAWYDDNVELRRRPARRVVYHIFKRWHSGEPRAHVEAEVADLRRRVLAGEPFQELAADHSDSELRHQQGSMGMVERGQLPPDLDALVFSLEENSPSEPISTRDGVHLFLVTIAVEAKEFTFEELRAQAMQAVMAAKREQAVEGLVAQWRLDEDRFAVDEERLRELWAGNDEFAVVMRVGDYELTVADFRALLARAARRGGGQTVVSPAGLLESLEKREVIYGRVMRERMVDAEEVERRLAARVEDELAAWYLEKRLLRFLEDRPARLQEHYESNAMRFTNPLRLRLRLMIVPLGDVPDAVMARLEAARDELDAGRLELSMLASELGGRTEDLGWMTLPELQRLEPKAVLFAGHLATGRHSPPYRGAAGLEILYVTDREEPVPRPYAAVKERVRDDLLRSRPQEVAAEMANEMLAEAQLAVDRDRIRHLIDTGFGAIDQ